MSDAQATFTATLDSSGIQTGAKSALSALEKLGQQIQRRSKDLAAMKAAQVRLVQSAGVQEYLKRQKAIEKNEAFEKKATERAIAANAKRGAAEKLATAQQINAQSATGVDAAEMARLEEAAKALGVTADDAGRLAQEAMKAEEALSKVKAEVDALQASQDQLTKDDKAVSQFVDQAKVIKSTESELADLQSQYSAAGGSAADLAEEIKEPKSAIMSLAEEAKKAGGPVGAIGGILEKVGGMKAAGPLALLAVIIAIGAAAIKTAYALAKMALVSADMARTALIKKGATAFGSPEGIKQIDGAMKALRGNTGATKGEAQELASKLYQLGDRGQHLEDTALTIQRFGEHSEEAKGAVAGLYDQLRKPVGAVGIADGVAKSMQITADMLPRDVFLELAMQLGKDGNRALINGFTANKDDIRNALSRIGSQKFAGPAEAQMRTLDKLSERLHENLSSLFEQLKVGVLLGALQKLVGLLDETSKSGQSIRKVLGSFAQPFANAVEAALPYLEAFLEGMIYTVVVVALMAVELSNALADIIPESLTKNIDWLQVAFWGGAAAMGIMVAATLAVAATLFILATPFLLIIGLIALIITGIVMTIDALVGFADDCEAAFAEVDFADIAGAILDGIIGGLADGAADLYASMANLATGAYDAFKAAIKSKSPSVLFRMAGRTIPQGTALGIEDETPQVESAVEGMASPADMVSPNGGRRGGGINFVIQAGAVVINGVSGADELADEGFLRSLGRSLVAAAREGGLSPEPETA
jgi:hypothetical protein